MIRLLRWRGIPTGPGWPILTKGKEIKKINVYPLFWYKIFSNLLFCTKSQKYLRESKNEIIFCNIEWNIFKVFGNYTIIWINKVGLEFIVYIMILGHKYRKNINRVIKFAKMHHWFLYLSTQLLFYNITSNKCINFIGSTQVGNTKIKTTNFWDAIVNIFFLFTRNSLAFKLRTRRR